MKIKDRLNALCKKYNCELEDSGEVWSLWLPEGMEWDDSRSQVLCERYCLEDCGHSWKPDAIKELEERAAGGVSAEPVATLCPVLDCYGMG